MKRSIIAIVGIAALPLVAGAQNRDEDSFTWSKAMPAGATLTIKTGNGPIEVREGKGDKVEVRAVKRAGRRSSPSDVTIDVSQSGSDVTICTLYGNQTSCNRGYNGRNIDVRVSFVVEIPSNLRLNLTSGNGDITIDKAGADVMATTGNGRVSVGETSGRVEVTSGNGDIIVESASGPVRVNTGNGRVFVATSLGPVVAGTGNGDVDVRMKALTSSTPMSFSSGSGNIRVTLPADFNGDLDATTGNGEMRTDFEIQIVGRLNPNHLRGTIGKGGSTLRLSTGNGRIEIRKG
jgi:DUF4097 and DUF4098 domain-containing protein YvlB